MKKYKKIILTGILFIIISYGYYFLNIKFNFSIKCLFHELTGLLCPGCGVTRMIFSLINFDIAKAFHYNPLVFILLIGYILYIIINIISLKIFKKEIHLSNKWTYIILVIVILFGILRNIPIN